MLVPEKSEAFAARGWHFAARDWRSADQDWHFADQDWRFADRDWSFAAHFVAVDGRAYTLPKRPTATLLVS